MHSYREAIAQILEKVTQTSPAGMPILDAFGLVSAEDVIAPGPVPPFANSAMDGYAVRAEDVRSASHAHPIALPVSGEVAAGNRTQTTLMPGAAIRVMTGAPLPDGADAVVPVEDTTLHGSNVHVLDSVAAGRYIRAVGEDVQTGDVVVSQDTVLQAAEIGMCATVGRASVRVYPRPRVAIISTGDELVEPGSPLEGGQIYNSNAYALAAQVREAGGAVISRQIARDTPEAVREALDACGSTDVILTSGGVSVGGYDYVKSVFAERGTLEFWRVAIRPGKPLAFGTWGSTLFFGLPGNPVSSMVTFELFVRPALLKMRGMTELSRPSVQARLLTEARHEPGRQSYQRAFAAREGDAYSVQPVGGQGSHQMHGMVQANALLVLPDRVAHLAAGEYATVLILDSANAL